MSDSRTVAHQVKRGLEANIDALAQLVPTGVDINRMVRVVVSAVNSTPELMKCTPSSIILAASRGFAVGLEPNTALNLAYLVPFKGQATFMPSYRGLAELAYRSRKVLLLSPEVVYDGDEFQIQLGTERKIHHVPNITGNRGNLIGAYCTVKLANGESDFEWMPVADLERIRQSSRGKNSPAWSQWSDEMHRKAPLKRLCKRLPVSADLAEAIAADNSIETGQQQDNTIKGVEIELDDDSVRVVDDEQAGTEGF